MPEFRLPEATLIDIKRISKDYQNKWQAKINYSRLFDLKEEYKFPDTYCEFSALGCVGEYSKKIIVGTLTSTMNLKQHFYIIDIKMRDNKYNDYREYVEFNDPETGLAIRPVFKYNEIKQHCQIFEELEPGYLLVTFGNYPNRMVYDRQIKDCYIGTCFWENPKPIPTGNKYNIINYKNKEKDIREYQEVTFEGNEGRYIIKNDKIYKVEPVYFLVDVKKGFAISRDVLFCLPTFVNAKEASSIKETLPYEFLNTYFVPELVQSITRQNEKEIISEENPVIKALIDSILQLIKNTCIENIVKKELQNLINEYNNDLEKEKNEKEDIGLTLIVPETPESKFIEKLQSLYSKIETFSYYKESKIIYSCLNTEKELDIDSELYKDIATILSYILPTLPEDLRKEYQEQIKKILEYAEVLINELYQTPNKEQINIELKVRARLQPILEKLQKDVATNYIAINLNEIISGLFKTSSDLYQAHLFDSINSILKEIEILIESNKLETYKTTLTEILNNEDINNENYLISLYIKLIKLKNKIAEELNKSEKLERKKIKRKYF